jgi:hypothetical protein
MTPLPITKKSVVIEVCCIGRAVDAGTRTLGDLQGPIRYC